jgi:hypothetical protein
VDSTLRGFDTLKTQHRNVSAKTRALHESCERLVEEKERLVEFAEALRSKLAYFDELERIASQFHSGVMAVDSDHFLPILHRLDECITCAPGHLIGSPAFWAQSQLCSKWPFVASLVCSILQESVPAGLARCIGDVCLTPFIKANRLLNYLER